MMFQVRYKKVSVSGLFKTLLIAAFVMQAFTACKKDLRVEEFPASLTVVNAINDNTSFVTAYFGETAPKVYGMLMYIGNGNSLDYATDKMNQPLTLFINYDTLNTGKPLVKTRSTLEPAGIFTHFVYGSPTLIKQKTVKENLPARNLNDSVANLRIINLFDNRPIDVIQLEPAAGTIVSNLAYEQLSGFIKIPVNPSVQNFRFEVKDHETGITLVTLSEANIYPGSTLLNPQWLFKARTMLVTGTWTDAADFSAKAKSIGHF